MRFHAGSSLPVSGGKRPRVLFVASFLPEVGKGQTMAPLARQAQSLRDLGIPVSTIQVNGLPKLKYLQTIGPLRRAARKVDLIHAHYGYCGWLARFTDKPLIISFMGDDLLGTPDRNGRISRKSRIVVASSRWIARKADAVIVKSREMADVLAPARAHIIPNGVDLSRFRPLDRTQVRQQLGWPQDREYVLFAGDPGLARKGFDFAKSAVAAASKLLGRELALKILWQIEPSDVPLLMNACDALVMTSHVEGSPNVVKEAMACNLPVVSVPVGDVVELFDGVDGYRVVPRQSDIFGATLADLLRQSSPVGGRAAIHDLSLDLESVALRISHIYHRVLDSAGTLTARSRQRTKETNDG